VATPEILVWRENSIENVQRDTQLICIWGRLIYSESLKTKIYWLICLFIYYFNNFRFSFLMNSSHYGNLRIMEFKMQAVLHSLLNTSLIVPLIHFSCWSIYLFKSAIANKNWWMKFYMTSFCLFLNSFKFLCFFISRFVVHCPLYLSPN